MTNGLVTVVGPYDRPLALLFYCFANLKTIDEGINVELVSTNKSFFVSLCL